MTTETKEKLTTEEVKEILNSSNGTAHYYKPFPALGMIYTDGVKYFAEKCGAYWLIDLINSHMNTIIKDCKESEEYIYFLFLEVKDNKAVFKATREVYNGEQEVLQKVVASQDIEFTDLPDCSVKFYLQVAEWEPLTLCLMCPSEY